jgi:hypothetical protein
MSLTDKPLQVRKLARKLLRARWDREAAQRLKVPTPSPQTPPPPKGKRPA